MTPDLATDDDLQRTAKKRVDAKLGFLTHLMVFLCVNGGLWLLGVLSSGELRPWSFPLWGWGLGLLIHGVVTAASLLGGDLREQMMAAELRRLRQRG